MYNYNLSYNYDYITRTIIINITIIKTITVAITTCITLTRAIIMIIFIAIASILGERVGLSQPPEPLPRSRRHTMPKDQAHLAVSMRKKSMGSESDLN